jgi:hypothetical protein
VGEEAEVGAVVEAKMLPLVGGSASNEVVEDVEVALSSGSVRNARLLDEVLESLQTGEPTLVAKLKLRIPTEAGGVRVGDGGGVAEGIEDEEGGGDGGNEFRPFLAGWWCGEVDEGFEE